MTSPIMQCARCHPQYILHSSLLSYYFPPRPPAFALRFSMKSDPRLICLNSLADLPAGKKRLLGDEKEGEAHDNFMSI